MSSSLEEIEDLLTFLFCDILKNLRKTLVIKAPGEKLKINCGTKSKSKGKQ